ncbi:MAG: trypsin-like peptidase domain-containing protein [Nitrospina sp.]|nr:trypsin-like peptidase domain-containing protein [Nitrospina sp.]
MPTMIRTKTSSTLKILLILFLSGFLVTCAIAPVKKSDININHNLGAAKVLDDTQVVIHMRPEDREKVYTIVAPLNVGINWKINEGLLIESAAIKTFSKVFKNIKSSVVSKISNLVITVSGVSFVNTQVGGYSAEAKAVVSLARGDKLAEYEATGRVGGMWDKINQKNGFESAYVKAFIEIFETMLGDIKLAKYFENGFGEIQTANLPERQPMPQSSEIAKAPEKQLPQSGTGSGFFVSKLGHVITNSHVVQNCNRVTIGDDANKQVPAEVVNTDRSNDLALLKLSSLEMASAESKSLIQKLSIVVVPLASKGLLRSEDVRLGEKLLVAGYPFGDAFSNSIKVTTGVVSSTRGVGDDSGQFQLDAAVQPGNSGGPIYDSSGNIVGVVISQLNKKTFGSLVENVNFGIKASTVRQFLVSSGLSSKKSEQAEEKSTEQLAKIAQNQALMVICHQ